MWTSFFKTNKTFFIPMLAYLILGAWVIWQIPKGQLELSVNHNHKTFLDYFFLGFTYLGDGLSLALLLLYVLFTNVYKGIVGGISLVFSTILTHYFKNFVFPDYHRPSLFFESVKDIYYVKNLEIHAYHSFPSGHTSAAFCVFAFLAFASNNKKLGIVFWIIALLISLSRIYLMQHFFIDTYFGALLGTICAGTVYLIFEQNQNLKSKWSRKLWVKKKSI